MGRSRDDSGVSVEGKEGWMNVPETIRVEGQMT